MQEYLSEFLSLALIHFLAVIAPGPDFAITTANSLRYGRKIGILTALGIGAGISIHVIYSLAGLSFLEQHTAVFTGLRLAGAFYLLYLAYGLLRPASAENPYGNQPLSATLTLAGAFFNGFFTNVLNPKAVLFFVAIFSSTVSPRTPLGLKWFYGIWLCGVSALWFTFVALFLTQPRIRKGFVRYAPYINKAMGYLLFALAFYVLYQQAQPVFHFFSLKNNGFRAFQNFFCRKPTVLGFSKNFFVESRQF